MLDHKSYTLPWPPTDIVPAPKGLSQAKIKDLPFHQSSTVHARTVVSGLGPFLQAWSGRDLVKDVTTQSFLPFATTIHSRRVLGTGYPPKHSQL